MPVPSGRLLRRARPAAPDKDAGGAPAACEVPAPAPAPGSPVPVPSGRLAARRQRLVLKADASDPGPPPPVSPAPRGRLARRRQPAVAEGQAAREAPALDRASPPPPPASLSAALWGEDDEEDAPYVPVGRAAGLAESDAESSGSELRSPPGRVADAGAPAGLTDFQEAARNYEEACEAREEAGRGRTLRPRRTAARAAVDALAGLAASDGESSEDGGSRPCYAVGSKAPAKLERIGSDHDAEVTEWLADLDQRGGPELRSSFSKVAISATALRQLPATSFIGGRAIFDADGLVNLHLLLGSYRQLCERPEVRTEETSRHIGWLARRAAELALINESELRRGRLNATARSRAERRGAAQGEEARMMLHGEGELRFPARPLARQAEGDACELFGKEGEDRELRRKKQELYCTRVPSTGSQRLCSAAVTLSYGIHCIVIQAEALRQRIQGRKGQIVSRSSVCFCVMTCRRL